MSEEITKGQPRDPSFEEKVMARLDAIDSRLHALEVESQRRSFDTKPIWERALAEILELKQGQAGLKQGQDELKQGQDELRQGQDELRQGQVELKEGLDEVKEGLFSVDRKIGVLSSDVIQVRADQLHLERRVEKLEPKPIQ